MIFVGYSGFLHYLQLASHQLAIFGINVTKNKIPKKKLFNCEFGRPLIIDSGTTGTCQVILSHWVAPTWLEEWPERCYIFGYWCIFSICYDVDSVRVPTNDDRLEYFILYIPINYCTKITGLYASE